MSNKLRKCSTKSSRPFLVFGSPCIGDEEIEAVAETLRSGWIGTGPKVAQFEEQMADYCNSKYATAVSSCTAALHLSMLASGIGPGDEVITTSLTFAATVNSIIHAGAMPVLVDVDRRTMNIDPEQIQRAITPRTKAILAVHFAGRPCDMDAIHDIADKHNLLVIEDAAHAIEAEYKGRHIGSISELTCFSFYVTKNITTGEGGLILSRNQEIHQRLQELRLHGMSADAWGRFGTEGYKQYEVVYPGYKYNMTDMQASMGLVQLRKIEPQLQRRREIWERYDTAFLDLPLFIPAPEEKDTRHARHLYTLLVDIEKAPVSRDDLIVRLKDRGIGTGVHYRGVHLHKYYRDRFGFSPGAFPNTEWIGERTLSLPLSAKLTDEDTDRVIEAVCEVFAN